MYENKIMIPLSTTETISVSVFTPKKMKRINHFTQYVMEPETKEKKAKEPKEGDLEFSFWLETNRGWICCGTNENKMRLHKTEYLSDKDNRILSMERRTTCYMGGKWQVINSRTIN